MKGSLVVGSFLSFLIVINKKNGGLILDLIVGKPPREACSREACGRVGVAKGAGTGEPPPAGSGGRVGPSRFFGKIELKCPLEVSILTQNSSCLTKFEQTYSHVGPSRFFRKVGGKVLKTRV